MFLFETRADVGGGLGTNANYDVTADGQRFIIASRSSDADNPPITVVVNWTAALQRFSYWCSTRSDLCGSLVLRSESSVRPGSGSLREQGPGTQDQGRTENHAPRTKDDPDMRVGCYRETKTAL